MAHNIATDDWSVEQPFRNEWAGATAYLPGVQADSKKLLLLIINGVGKR